MENKNLNISYLNLLNTKSKMRKYIDSHVFKTIDDKIIFFVNNKMVVQKKSKSSFIMESLKDEAKTILQKSTNIYYFDDDEMIYKNMNTNDPLVEDEEPSEKEKIEKENEELRHEITELESSKKKLKIALKNLEHKNFILNEKMDCRNKSTFNKLLEEEDNFPKKIKKSK